MNYKLPSQPQTGPKPYEDGFIPKELAHAEWVDSPSQAPRDSTPVIAEARITNVSLHGETLSNI